MAKGLQYPWVTRKAKGVAKGVIKMNKWSIFLMAILSILSSVNSQESVELSSSTRKKSSAPSNEIKTFDQIANKSVDHTLVQQIRDKLINDKSLSKNGKNIQIIIVDKEITLKGPIDSDGEKARIINLTSELSDQHSIRNQLEVIRDKY